MSTNSEQRIFEILDDFRERLTRIETHLESSRCSNPNACIELAKDVSALKERQSKALLYGTLLGGLVVGSFFGVKEGARKLASLFFP